MDNSDRLNDVQHVLAWYSREDDRLVGERPLREIGIEQLKVVFRPSEADPLMYDSYAVGQEAAKFLGEALAMPLDLEHFDYFIECDAATPLQ